MRPQRRWLWFLFGLLIAAGAVQLAGQAPRLSLAAPSACVPGPHGGAITSDQSWCLVDSPHLITADTTIAAGVTVTVEPGVTVKAANNVALYVQGTLEAMGASELPITFTSDLDTASYQWAGIAIDGGTANLAHVTIRYAGRRNALTDTLLGSGHRSALTARNATLTVDHVTVRDIGGDGTEYGLLAGDSRITLADSLFTAIGGGSYEEWDVPIGLMGGQTVLAVSNTVLSGNANDRVLLYPGAMMGYANPILPAGFQMDGYEVRQDFTVPAGVTLTIEPGVTVMSGPPLAGPISAVPDFFIQGRLVALGTPTQPITFTSVADSAPYQWIGLCFDGGTGTLRHAVVRYAGRQCDACPSYTGAAIQARNVQAGELAIQASQIISTSGTNTDLGLYIVNSRVTVTDTAFSSIGDAGTNDAVIALSAGGALSLQGSALTQNAAHGVVVIDGAAQVQIVDTSILDNSGHGVWLSGDTASLTMSGSVVLGNSLDGVRNQGNAQVTLGGALGLANTILGNGGFGANQMGTSVQMNATYNWWGHASGPYHSTLNPDGLGERVSDRVLFDPWGVSWQGDAPQGVFVTVAGPPSVNPGGRADYVVAYYNGRQEAIEDAVLMMVLPAMVSFQDATHSGEYMAQEHLAMWKLGDLAPGESGTAAVQVVFGWGLPIGASNAVQARLGGTNLPLGLVTSGNVQSYLDFQPLRLLSSTSLSEAELAGERLAHPDLDQLYTEATEDGFLAGGAVRLALNAGEPITQVVLLKRATIEVMYLRRQGDTVLASVFGPNSAYTVRAVDGGLEHDLSSLDETYSGSWGSVSVPSAVGLAFSNCRYANLSRLVLEDKLAHLWQGLGSATCYPCLSGGSCGSCFAALQNMVPLPEASGALVCAAEASAAAASQPAPTLDPLSQLHGVLLGIQSDPNDSYYECSRSWWDWWTGKPWKFEVVAAPFGVIDRSSNVWPGECGSDQVCITGLASEGGGCKCPDTKAALSVTGLSVQPAGEDVDGLLSCAGEEEGASDCNDTDIVAPRDPNAKYGPQGDLVAGQLVTYTITYENVGDGRAYGVFVVDQLDAAFDLSSLTIYGPGELIAESRTILWTFGELGPVGTIDSQGVVSFTVKLFAGLPAGTVVVNQATVYFPTVGEVTPTNPVVNVVQPVAAVPQRVETTYAQPVAITLMGRGPAGVALSYQVVEQPLNGTLGGAAPNLIYTPAANATGLDRFTFRVSGGGQESREAEVQIVINPSGDATPPQVVWTYPADGATDVAIRATALRTDETGPIFLPLPFAQFSEALDPATVSDALVHVVDADGAALPVTVFHSAPLHRLSIQPRQALQGQTVYTVTLGTGLRDLAGNALKTTYTWSFETGVLPAVVYLPLVLR